MSTLPILDVRQRLEARAHTLRDEIDQGRRLQRERLDEQMGPHDRTDEAAQYVETEIEEREMERDREELQEVIAALHRLDENKYGLCVECGSTIDAERLRARPSAPRCMACQTKADKHEMAPLRFGT